MPPSRELDPSASPLALLGAELRKYRKSHGWSQEQLAERINFSPSLLGFVERAERPPRREFIERCEEALGLNGELLRLWPLISRETSPRWFRPWLEIEAEAKTLRTWEPLVIPGLLQTEEYARALIQRGPGITPQQVDDAVTARMERQSILRRTEPPMLWAVIDESVLLRPVHSAEAMYRQLEHLITLAEQPRITIQIVPWELGAHPGLLGGFVIAQLQGNPDTVYLESAGSGHATDRAEDIMALNTRYDAIRAEALPQQASIALIRKKMEETWS